MELKFPIKFRCFILLLSLVLPSVVQGQFTFTTNRDGSLNIYQYTGSAGVVIIPAAVNGLPVTTIGTDAFYQDSSLTSVEIGTNVAVIGTNAFFQCPNLASVSIPASVTNIGQGPFIDCQSLTVISLNVSNQFYTTTNGVLFDSTQTMLIQFPGGTGGGYTIPAAVTSVGAAFVGNTLSAIAVDPANLYYSSTNGVLFNKTQKVLVQYPGGAGGSYAVPTNVITIQSAAFEYSPGIAGVVIGTNVASIGEYAFYDCTSLNAIFVDPTNLYYSTTNGVLFNKNGTDLIQFPSGQGGTYIVPGSVTAIENGAFGDAFQLTAVVIPDSVTSIGEEAFYSCEGLANVSLGNSVATIGQNAFYYCIGLTSITIPNSVTNIGQDAFYYCQGLTGATLGSGVASLGEGAFAACQNLARITFLGNAPTADSSVLTYDNDATVYYLPGTSGWMPTFSGIGTVMFDPPVPAGSLQLTISPFTAVIEGAQWQVDNGVPQPSAATVLGLSVGNHTVSFNAVDGWTTPVNQTVTVTANSTTAATATYLPAAPTGSLEVTINPSTIDAQWQVDGGALQNSGATVANLSVGNHTVSFTAVSGWTTPANLTISVTANATASATGTYVTVAPTGSLQVTISPSAIGAQWQVDGGALQNSGATVGNLPVGNHTVSFTAVSGWTTPANLTISVAANATATATGTYVQQFGSLKVIISPAAAATDGAKWQVDGGTLKSSGATVANLSVGSHTVSFGTIAGWTTPANQIVSISALATAAATGTYVALPPSGSLKVTITPTTVVAGGAQWQVDGGAFQNSGTTVANLAPGNHTVSFSPLSGWTTPPNATISIKAKVATAATGSYTNEAQGIYNGLFSVAGGVTEATAGMLGNLKLGAQGTYTATLLIAGGTYGFSGAFNFAGVSHTNVTRPAAQGGPLAVAMTLQAGSPPQITGTISGNNGGAWTANLVANPAAKSASADYTVLLLPAGTASPNLPPGDGYILLTNKAGIVTVTGALADGTSLTTMSQTVPVDATGDVPIYDSLYAKTGLLLGWLNLTNLNGAPTTNALAWIKPPSHAAKLYPNGFTTAVFPQGAAWTNPPANTPAIPLTDGTLVISNTGLFLTFNVAVGNNNMLVKLPGSATNQLTGIITGKTGLLTITFENGKTTTTGTAALLQSGTNAGGFFPGTTNAGSIILQP